MRKTRFSTVPYVMMKDYLKLVEAKAKEEASKHKKEREKVKEEK